LAALGCGRARAPITVGVIDVRPYGAEASPLLALPDVRFVPLDGTDAAEEAVARGRCAGAEALVESAALERLAAPEYDPDDLVRLFRFAFRCANAASDRLHASAWVDRMRTLGVAEDDAWAAYPEIDATSNAQPVKLTIHGPGLIGVDLRRVGHPPAEIVLTPGRHWFLAEGVAVARDVTSSPARQELVLPPATPANRAESLRVLMRSWRLGTPVDDISLARTMRDAGLVLTVLLVPSGGAEVWKLDQERAVHVADVRDVAALRLALALP
jgi:hypothetical protein